MTDTIEEQIEQINKKIDQLMNRAKAEELPPPTMYRLGDNEFIFRVQQIVLVELLREHLDMSEEEFDLLLKKKWLEQAEMWLKNNRKAKITAQVAVPEQRRMFLPPGVEL
jgi:hypothetical protein